ncbi:MAG TPA: hypothetical protein VFS94_05770 [Gemmatimonadales bacterium]|nr:hypothetical protein [Gemmatimonadales bacterium]
MDDAERTSQLARLALTALALGALAGTAVVTATLMGVVSAVRPEMGPSPLETTAGVLLVSGTLGGVAVAALLTWVVLAPLNNYWRRAMLATVAGFATVVLMLVARPAHAAWGTTGLVVLLLACVVGIILLGRRVARLSR